MRRPVAAGVAALALLAGCGEGDEVRPGVVLGDTLTIHASMPLRGPGGEAGRDAVRAHRLALEEAGGRVGRLRIRYVPRDSATGPEGRWDPERTALNARDAVRDQSTIAYLGEPDWEATAISLPILNQGGVLQVSATSTYAGLTREEGAGADEPDRFYPSGQRTFARVIPADHVQGRALATMMADADCGRAFVVDDALPAGVAVADGVRREARAQGLALAGRDPLPQDQVTARTLAEKIARRDADCVAIAATPAPTDVSGGRQPAVFAAPAGAQGGRSPAGAVELVRALAEQAPWLPVVASYALADQELLEELGPAAEAQLQVVTPMLAASAYPDAGQRFLLRFRERFGRPAAAATLYDYDAMKALLAALAEAGDLANDRAEVIAAFFGLQDRESVLGTYDIDDNGDTTLADYGANRVRSGRLIFDRVVEPPEG